MKQKILLFILLIQIQIASFAQYDLVIVGGTPGGIMTAISAARLGKTSVILERTAHIGGLPANGLGATDIATRGATTGLFLEFVERILKHYIETYGANSDQVKTCSNGYHFESSVAEKVFEQMLAEHKDKVTVFKMRQFDAEPNNISIRNDQIISIKILDRLQKQAENYQGKIFVDATYEGDLAAAATVPFFMGREGKSFYNEPGAGRVYKFWGGEEGSGSTFQDDNAVQAYNYRLCLTNNSANKVEVKKPTNFNRNDYVSMIEDVWTGNHTGVEMKKVNPAMIDENRKVLAKGGSTIIPGDKWGISKITNQVFLPNRKTDSNNQHQSFLSTDLPEENWPWPTSGWDWRDKFAKRLKDYTLGLLWFAQNDKDLPEQFRKACLDWGLAKDEYVDNDNFPRQVYVREGRRFDGMYFFTAKDAIPVTPESRPPLHNSSITASHYALDSHAVRKREAGRVHLDGFLSYPTAVYTVPFGVIVPKTINNLLMPVPVSGSHIGFSTLRMEPCWMALGQAAGVAAALAIDDNVKMRNLAVHRLQRRLLEQKVMLLYFRDIDPSNPDFVMVQTLGLMEYLPEWTADLKKQVDEITLDNWRKLSGLPLAYHPGKNSRGEVLRFIYQNIKINQNS